MKQSIVLFIFALFSLYKSSEAGIGGAAGYSGDADEAYLFDIDCGDDGQQITFEISIPDIDQWSNGEESDWVLVDSAASGSLCQPAPFTGVGFVRYGPFNAAQCAKVITTDEDTDNMEVMFEVDVGTSGGQITFQYEHHYQITCWYSTISNLQASFLPLHSVFNDGTDLGDLTFTFKLYFLNGAQVTTDYIIDLESILKAVLTVNGGGFSTLDVHIEALVATTNQGYSWNLIEDGCSLDLAVMSDSTCDDDNDEEVGFRAFRFAGQLDTPSNALVTFEVTAIVCLPDEPGNQCDLDCLACDGLVGEDRKRRSLDGNRIKEAKFYVRAGPYKFATVDKKNQQDADDVDNGDEGGSSTFPTYLMTILLVSGVVVFAVVGAAVVIVLRKRRRSAALSVSRGTAESSAGPV